jgi:hypothetical protein
MNFSRRIASVSRSNTRMADAGAGPMVRAGLHGMKKQRSCMGAVSGFLTSLFTPAQESEMSPHIEMANRAPDNLQLIRESLVDIPRPPRAHQIQPRVRDGNYLSHHSGGLADNYYRGVHQRSRPTHWPTVRPCQPPATLLENLTDDEQYVRKLLQKVQASDALHSTNVSGPGTVLSTSKGMVSFPFGGPIISYEVACPSLDSNKWPPIVDHTMTSSLLPLNNDSEDDWGEDITEHLNDIGIPMVRPTNRRMVLSVGSEDSHGEDWGIPRVRPASHRRVLSDCSSEGLTEDDSDANDIPMARPGSRRRALSDCFSVGSNSDNENEGTTDLATAFHQANRVSSISSNDSASSASTTYSEEPANLFPSEERGAQRFPVLVEATTCRSLTAEVCYASDEDEEEEEKNPAQTFWLSGRPKPNLTIYIPRADSGYEMFQRTETDTIDAFEPELIDQDTHRVQNLANRIDLDIPMFEDSGWLEAYQEMSDLHFAGEDQACLVRFAHLWENEYAEPVDQLLFADFDADFTIVSTAA